MFSFLGFFKIVLFSVFTNSIKTSSLSYRLYKIPNALYKIKYEKNEISKETVVEEYLKHEIIEAKSKSMDGVP